MEKIRITLETLYDILRNEKKREDLQKLEDTFFLDIVSYLREKQTLLDQKHGSDELFAAGEKDKLEYELRSIKRILKEIYEKREKKIIDISLNRSRTGSDIIDTSAMLREEKEFYDHTLKILNSYRKGILGNLFKGELPAFIKLDQPEIKDKVQLTKKKEPSLSKPSTFTKFEGAPAMIADDEEQDEPEEPEEELTTTPTKEQSNEETNSTNTTPTPPPTLEMSKIKFLHPVPSFVWKDLKVYGPFDSGEKTEIFSEVANLLIRKGRAEKA